MHELYELKEKLLKELSEYAQNGKFSKEDAEVMKYLSSTIDHICNIVMDMEEEGYSERGRSYAGGGSNRGGSYEGRGGRGGNQGGGSSNRGGSYEGGSYARGRGRNTRRDSMGRYSREGGYSRGGDMEEMVESIRDIMQELPESVQRDAQRFVQKLEQEMM